MNRPDEPLFAFITNEDFRESLQSDYRELLVSIEQKAWKAAHVLSGSIIEAMLIDCLIAIGYSKLPEDKILRMNLGPAISACKDAGVLTPMTANLSSVIQDYRNLIHPGRVVRTGQSADEDGANVALALLRMVSKEIARAKFKSYGYTAEQIIDKIETDLPSVDAILPGLIREVNETEKKRLLLRFLPAKNQECRLEMPERRSLMRQALSQCFRLIFNQVPIQIRREVTKTYIKILKEQGEHYRNDYEASFFRAGDLSTIDEVEERDLVKRHIFARLKQRPNDLSVWKLAEGIGTVMTIQDVDDGLARSLWQMALDSEFYDNEERLSALQLWLSEVRYGMAKAVKDRFDTDFQAGINYYHSRGSETYAILNQLYLFVQIF